MTNPSRPGTDHGAPYTSASDAKTPPPAQEKASLLDDFIEIFYAPSKVFARRANSGFWAPLLVIWIISALFTFASRSVTSAIFDVEFSRSAAKAMAANPQITQEMMNAQRGISEAIGSVIFYLAMPIIVFLVGTFIWLAAKLVSAKLSYQSAVLIATLSQIPRLLQGVLTTVQGLLMDTTTITSQHSVGISPARFMDADTTPKQLLDFVGRFDLFTLWVTALIGIGIAVVAKVPRSRGFAAAAIVWGIATLLTVVSVLWS